MAGVVGSTGYADGFGTNAQFSSPFGITLDSASGLLTVADYGNNRIRSVNVATGAVNTLAGGSAGAADGVGSSAHFNGPYAVAVDNSGTLYVADRNNHMIRTVTPSGVVSTLAGSVTPGFMDGISGPERGSTAQLVLLWMLRTQCTSQMRETTE